MRNQISFHLWSGPCPAPELTLSPWISSGEQQITIFFPALFESTKPIRDYIHALLQNLHVSNTETNRLVLITDELVNNSIEHGSAPRENNEITLRLRLDHDRLNFGLSIRDHGNGAYPKSASDMEKMRQEKLTIGFENYRGRRWRGLFQITTKAVDALHFSDHPDGGLVVSIEKSIQLEKA